MHFTLSSSVNWTSLHHICFRFYGWAVCRATFYSSVGHSTDRWWVCVAKLQMLQRLGLWKQTLCDLFSLYLCCLSNAWKEACNFFPCTFQVTDGTSMSGRPHWQHVSIVILFWLFVFLKGQAINLTWTELMWLWYIWFLFILGLKMAEKEINK